jgi:hypothetical protein
VPVFIFGYYLYPTNARHDQRYFENASFSARKNTNNDLPNTVVFSYNIDNVKGDSFFIQQSWDKNRRVRIYKNKYTITDIYYEPGYHLAKLIADDSVIKATEVSIPTNGWFFYVNENRTKYNTGYINTEKFTNNGSLALTTSDILNNKIDPDENNIYVYSYFPGKFKINGDNFSLATRVRMKEIRNNLCPYITIEVFCQRYLMMMKNTLKGCASESFLQFSEKTINGKETDLAAVSYDVTKWTDIELTVKNKHAVMKINGKESFSTDYENSTNLITGLVFLSNGLCEVDHVKLIGLDGTVMYSNQFE